MIFDINFVPIIQWFFIAYFMSLNLSYIVLCLISCYAIIRYLNSRETRYLPDLYSEHMPAISLLAPAYNEPGTIVATVKSLTQLEYASFEILVINDGSNDDTLAILRSELQLEPIIMAPRHTLDTMPLRGVYQSKLYSNVRVLDKENGGKAEALNCGINYSRHDLFCCIDADSILQRNSLKGVVQPFLYDTEVVAAGGTITIANGCEVKNGFLVRSGLPQKYLAKMQVVEYIRAFLFGRTGWASFNALLLISGAFGMFKKSAVLLVGGFRTNTVGEDMELVVRLHRYHREHNIPYKIVFVPDPICWTEAPEDLRTLTNQRLRWQRGLAESITRNLSILYQRRSGVVGFVVFPFFILFELLGPFIEVTSYFFITGMFIFGFIDKSAFFVFWGVAIGTGILLSTTALILEQLCFHIYPKYSDSIRMYCYSWVENFGYRQYSMMLRVAGLLKWMLVRKSQWGKMKRTSNWTQAK